MQYKFAVTFGTLSTYPKKLQSKWCTYGHLLASVFLAGPKAVSRALLSPTDPDTKKMAENLVNCTQYQTKEPKPKSCKANITPTVNHGHFIGILQSPLQIFSSIQLHY